MEHVAISADGRTVATALGSFDGTVRVWGVDGRAVSKAVLVPEGVYHVAMSADGRTVASASCSDETVRVWGVEHGRAVSKAVLEHCDARCMWHLARMDGECCPILWG